MAAAFSEIAAPTDASVVVKQLADGYAMLMASVDDIIFCLLGVLLVGMVRHFFGYLRDKGGTAKKLVDTKGPSQSVKGPTWSTKTRVEVRADAAQKAAKEAVQAGAVDELFHEDGSVDRAVEAMVEAMEGPSSKVTPDCIVAVLRECLRRKDKVAAAKVEGFTRERQIPFTLDMYEVLLKLHALCGDARAQMLFDEMLQDGFTANEAFCCKLFHQCAESCFPGFADHIQAFLRARSATTLSTYKALMHVYGSCGFCERACNMYEEARSNGHSPDPCMCGYLVRFAVKCGKKELLSTGLDRSLDLLNARPGTHGHASADDVLLFTVLDACVGCRDMPRLAGIVDTALGFKRRHSVYTYGVLIKACSLLQRTSLCKKLWGEMVDTRGLCPTDITLSCMLDALVRADAVGEAVDIFRTWQSTVSPNVVIYSTLIKGYAAMGDAEGAMRIFREMQATGVEMNTIAYTTLIDSQARGGDMAQAEGFFARMQREGIEPCGITYSTLMRGHCRAGDLTKAMDVFKEMKNRGMPLDVSIFHSLLEVCVHQSCFDLADWLLDELREKGISPTCFTLSLVVKMWGKRRRLHEAFAAVRTMPKEFGFQLETQTGSALISACFFNGAYNQALEALKIMKDSAHGKPDANTYGNVIINFARRNARASLHQCVELARDACGLPNSQPPKGGPVRPEAAHRLYHVLRLRGLVDDLGKPLQDELRAAAADRSPGAEARAIACASFLAAFGEGPTKQKSRDTK